MNDTMSSMAGNEAAEFVMMEFVFLWFLSIPCYALHLCLDEDIKLLELLRDP